MSVERKVILAVGMTEDDFIENFDLPTDDDFCEQFTDTFFIDSDSWCGGVGFYAIELEELEEGCYFNVENILNSAAREVGIRLYRREMEKFGIDVPQHLINFYIIFQVF